MKSNIAQICEHVRFARQEDHLIILLSVHIREIRG